MPKSNSFAKTLFSASIIVSSLLLSDVAQAVECKLLEFKRYGKTWTESVCADVQSVGGGEYQITNITPAIYAGWYGPFVVVPPTTTAKLAARKLCHLFVPDESDKNLFVSVTKERESETAFVLAGSSKGVFLAKGRKLNSGETSYRNLKTLETVQCFTEN